jgi:hypothetical protein
MKQDNNFSVQIANEQKQTAPLPALPASPKTYSTQSSACLEKGNDHPGFPGQSLPFHNSGTMSESDQQGQVAVITHISQVAVAVGGAHGHGCSCKSENLELEIYNQA